MRGVFILAFLVIMIGGALTLYAWRAPLLKSTAGFELGARESFLLFNNVLLVIAAAIVFGGTMAPLIADALGLRHGVGRPAVLQPDLPDADTAAARAAGGRSARELEERPAQASRGARCSRPASWLPCSAAVWCSGYSHAAGCSTLVGATLGLWIILSSLVDPIDRWRRSSPCRAPLLGMTIAHIGVGSVRHRHHRRAVFHRRA